MEVARLRASSEQEIARLNTLLQEAHASKEALRHEHGANLAARDHDLREAEQRHAAQERRLLAEVDRARQASKQLETGLTKEQQRRVQSEEAAAQTLDAGRRTLRDTQQAAQQLERELRDQLTLQASLLAQRPSHNTRRCSSDSTICSGNSVKNGIRMRARACCSLLRSQTCARVEAHVERRPGRRSSRELPQDRHACKAKQIKDLRSAFSQFGDLIRQPVAGSRLERLVGSMSGIGPPGLCLGRIIA